MFLREQSALWSIGQSDRSHTLYAWHLIGLLHKIPGETCLSRQLGNEVTMLFAMITYYGCYRSVLPKCPDCA